MLIFFLLISLCSSRAEGLHLLPFAGGAEPETSQSHLGSDEQLQYQLSRIPENSSAGITVDAGQDSQPAGFVFSSSVTDLAPYLWAAGPGTLDRRDAMPPRWRDLLASSTDRSPPLA